MTRDTEKEKKRQCDCEKPEELNTDYKDKWLRAQADYQNLVKETGEQKKEWASWSKRQIIEDFIPIYDNFKKAFATDTGELSKAGENWKKGIEYIKKQFSDVLSGHGIQEIKTVGETFDPNLHEAVSEQDGGKEGEIVKEVDAGYMMGDKVIKCAKVIVSK